MKTVNNWRVLRDNLMGKVESKKKDGQKAVKKCLPSHFHIGYFQQTSILTR